MEQLVRGQLAVEDVAAEQRVARLHLVRADHLAVLWFLAEAEGVSTRVMKAYISEERLMESELYKNILAKGEARGEAKSHVETIIGILTERLGALDPAIRERIRAVSDVETLGAWMQDVIRVRDAEAARRLVEKIQKAPLS